MKKVVSMSEAELEVMKMLWDQEGAIKQPQILALFEAEGKAWKRQTINTFLSRLEDKGLIKRENRLVEPLCSREEYVSMQVKALINRIYGEKLSNCDKEELADELCYAIQDCEPESYGETGGGMVSL